MKQIDTNIAAQKYIMTDNNCWTQVAALVYRFKNQQLEVLLMTSRDTGRWVLPKGWPQPGFTLAQSALAEAYEEAGIRGAIEIAPFGHYHYFKADLPPDIDGNIIVNVYPLLYSHREKKWPEQGQRRYKWESPEQASALVDEPELKQLLLLFRR